MSMRDGALTTVPRSVNNGTVSTREATRTDYQGMSLEDLCNRAIWLAAFPPLGDSGERNALLGMLAGAILQGLRDPK